MTAWIVYNYSLDCSGLMAIGIFILTNAEK